MMKHAALANAIADVGDACAAGVIAEFYEDNFWEARFGPRGRKYADEDCRHHVAHLLQALRADDAAVFVSYARWLQSLLCTRGMCSRHIAQNFQRLGARLRAALPAVDVAPAVAVLDQGVAALGADVGDDDAARVARAVGGGWPDVDDAALLLSHLCDAARLGRGELFAAHWQWRLSFHNVDDARAVVIVRALADAVVDHAGARRMLEAL